MIYTAMLLSVLLPLVAFVADLRRMPPHRLAISPFWYFTFLYLAAFPLRAWLLDGGYTKAQVVYFKAMPQPTSEQLGVALLVSLVFWAFVYIGYRTVRDRDLNSAPQRPRNIAEEAVVEWRILGVLVVLGLVAAAVILYLNPTPNELNAQTNLKARAGNAALWVAPELPVYGVIGVAAVLAATRRQAGAPVFVLLLLAVSAEMFWISNMLSTRRVLAAVLLALVVTVVLRRPRYWLLGVAGVVGTVFASPVFEEVRRLRSVTMHAKGFEGVLAAIMKQVTHGHTLEWFSQSFEGIEHVSWFLQKTTWQQLLTGVDHGTSWLFNLGLSFVPRAVWASKPLVYGGMEQFRWMYPSYFKNGIGLTAIPTSFVVDLSFGFGIIVGLVLAVVLGRFLAACGNVLWRSAASPAAVAIAICVFVFTFNTVRGGTALAQSLVPMGVIGVLMFGVRPMLRGIAEVLMPTAGRQAKPGAAADG